MSHGMVTKALLGMAPAVLRQLWLLSLVTFALAQQPVSPDPVQSFCSRWWSQSTIKNDTLYIDSGVQKFDHNKNLYFGTNTYILAIPLNYTWDWYKGPGDSQYLSITSEPKNFHNNKTGTPIPNNVRGYMFSGPKNSSHIYQFGGTTYTYNTSFMPSSSSYPLWTYTPGLDSAQTKWNQYDILQQWKPNHGAGADAPDLGLGFYLNGQVDKGTSAITDKVFDDTNQTYYTPVDGMLVIDLVNPGSAAANISTSAMRGNLARVGGTLDYIPSVGESGILVALGGQIQPTLRRGKASIKDGQLIDFKSVDVFDINSYLKNPKSNGVWYQQSTTGDIPPPRIDYCTIAVSAPDNSSHHIYLYGGYNPTSTTPAYFDDVVVLSIPSFSWKTIWQGDTPRWAHNCHLAGQRQMITVGGNNTRNDTGLKCDWEKKGVAVFDISTGDWGSVYSSNTPSFKIHNKLLPSTNGTSDGQARIADPNAGWSNKDLQKVFRQSRWTIPTSWPPPPENLFDAPSNPSNSSNRNPPSSNRTQDKKTTNTTAIAGGLSGGVICLGLICAALIYMHHRRRKALAELHSDHIRLDSVSSSPEKKRSPNFELQGINENNPAELDAYLYIEADNSTTTNAAELSGTNLAPGATPGQPHIRFPGDDLPVLPENPGGLRRPGSRGSTRSRRSSPSHPRNRENP